MYQQDLLSIRASTRFYILVAYLSDLSENCIYASRGSFRAFRSEEISFRACSRLSFLLDFR